MNTILVEPPLPSIGAPELQMSPLAEHHLHLRTFLAAAPLRPEGKILARVAMLDLTRWDPAVERVIRGCATAEDWVRFRKAIG